MHWRTRVKALPAAGEGCFIVCHLVAANCTKETTSKQDVVGSSPAGRATPLVRPTWPSFTDSGTFVMGWFTRFMARRGAIPSTANWACVQYAGFKKIHPEISDRELIERIIELRYSTLPIEPGKKVRLTLHIPLIKGLTDLAFEVLTVETDDGTPTSPFRNSEWVAEAKATIDKVVRTHGLHDIEFECDS